MIVISNSQRDQIVRYLRILCDTIDTSTTSNYNVQRLARKLICQLSNDKKITWYFFLSLSMKPYSSISGVFHQLNTLLKTDASAPKMYQVIF